MGKNLSILAEIEREKPKLYALIEMNIAERSEVEIKSVQTTIPTVGPRIPYLFCWTLSRLISSRQLEILWSMKMQQLKLIIPQNKILVNLLINIE